MTKKKDQDFAWDPKFLVDKAYMELQEDAKEKLSLRHYVGQWEIQQLAADVKQRWPKMLDEANFSMK